MSVAWVAGSTRAHAMGRRRAGATLVRAVASDRDLEAAIETVTDSPSPYGLTAGMGLREAQRSIVETAVWNLRVLAGWLPREGVLMLRLVGGPLEIANVEQHLRALAGDAPSPAAAYRLGSLGTAWRRLSRTRTASELADVLTSSPWGDPGGDSPRDLILSMRTALVARAMLSAPSLRRWAQGAGTLLLARERFLHQPSPPRAALANLSRSLGPAALTATTISELHQRVPVEARWALDGVSSPDELWRAEMRWWTVVAEDARKLMKGTSPGPDVVLGAAALLATDAWRLRGALALAARGGGRLEAFDALA